MRRERVDPPYKAFALLANGTRVPLEAHGVVVEVRPGVEIEIDFAPHPNFAGHLTLYTPPCARMKKVYGEGNSDSFAVVFGATNVLHVFVERIVRKLRKPNRSEPK